ncbi:S8 family serine peptidase [Mesobacillus foraminis]
MMRKIIGIGALLSLLVLTASGPAKLSHPPIPGENSTGRTVAIVLTEEPQSASEIRTVLAKYPDVKLRRIFKHALTGYSVEGPLNKVLGMRQSDIKLVSPVQTYRAAGEENMDLIGGEEVRSILDSKGRRLTGKGIRIGVIDTGIDYEHPDLHRSYAGGRDLVDGDQDPMETKGAGGTLHGTHVAGIIAANGRITGLAPDARIMAYRALGPGGMGTTEQVLAAIDEAIEDKVDVLNLSLGNDINGPDLPISLALNKAVEKGITAVTSSGNSGPGRWSVGSPGTASKAISVGASTPPLSIPYLVASGSPDKIRLELLQGSKEWKMDRNLQLADAGIGRQKDFRHAEGKVVLIQRGKLTFTQKAKNAYQAGARGVIIYNNTKGRFSGNLEGGLEIPVASITKEEGERLKKVIEQETVTGRIELKEEKDFLADFSSRGPVTTTWEIKPDVLAPGVAIKSTIPGGYLALQGTSMAAPHVAAACALVKQAHPEWEPAQIKAALMNTALQIKDRDGREYRTFEQGAGRIQSEKAAAAETLVVPGSLQFGRFRFSERMPRHKATIEIQNHGSTVKRYSFSTPKREDGLDWELPLAFELGPGERRKVSIGMTVDPKAFGQKIYDGFLEVNAGGEPIRIPYLYVMEEPDYPRVMGFAFAPADKPGTYRYEVYLPGGADEFGIALFDPEQLRFIGYLDWGRNLKRGLRQKEISPDRLPGEGGYLAKVFVKKAGREDKLETFIYIAPSKEE